MSAKRDYFFDTLHIAAWIIFVGVCIEAGGFLTSTIITLFFNPNYADKFWGYLDLSPLYKYNQSRFVSIVSILTIVSLLKAVMFYVIVKIFWEKKFSLSEPFSDSSRKFISLIAYIALGIGLFTSWGAGSTEKLIAEGVTMPQLHNMKFAGADVWFFMAVILLVVAQVFKKGIELQTENDLTV